MPSQTEQQTSSTKESLRLYRRLWLLRVSDELTEAERIQAMEFAVALDEARSLARIEGTDDALWQNILAREDARLAEAESVAELLAPLLAERLPLFLRLEGNADGESDRPRCSPSFSQVARLARASVPAIAEVIGDMQLLEHADSGSLRAS